ncbi:hypothetical protein AMATHDRAFT_139556 [Amanita thiersii Skay4041]|uniref:mRNA m(6)A methyltransferase n=1 Tax=Amanita thiersii Skay4041 TaxID=703135 RepID=A0A2A9NTJ2_9AGAR|nr:hypothetical protein AMATHDRAFT_139556 [Amanita thiersii Skay4041]
MPSDELRALTITALKSLFTSRRFHTPISSFHLLSSIISFTPPVPLKPRLRLTDLSLFESILSDLAYTWGEGILSLSHENGQITVLDVSLDVPGGVGHGEAVNPRKRKRVKDEDDDSAAGDAGDESSNCDDARTPVASTLANLNKEMRAAYAVLQRSTAKGRLLAEQFRSVDERFEPICSLITKDDCAKARQQMSDPITPPTICDRVHFRPLIRPHTDPALGHCSYLNTCYSEPTYAQSPSIPPYPGSVSTRGPVSLPSGLGAGGRGKEKAPCRYLHYEIDWDGGDGDATQYASDKGKKPPKKKSHKLGIGMGPPWPGSHSLPPQWINCDLRRFDYSVLGKFHVIMADPPWDIHMSLPYGTMTDDEMRAMPIPTLQDEGLLFLWVTGRAMEVGRECLRVWGYTRVDEVVWVKTNQLQRVIRTGRTGHWLNHTKEHMLVGIKTVIDANGMLKFPSWVNRGIDTDVIVSEVRETSRKPDEIYAIIERMCPGGRKVEIFGRKHNTRPGWLTLGNQLGPDQIFEEDLAARIKAKFVWSNIIKVSSLIAKISQVS